MQISSMNILETVTDEIKLLMPSNSKSCVGFWLTDLHLTVAHSKGQGQGNAPFDNEYPWNGNRYGKNHYFYQG